MFRKTRSLLGLDIGSNSVKAIELTNHGGEFVVTGFAHAPVVAEGSLTDTITEMVQQAGMRTRRVVTAVSGKSVIVRYLNMVPMSDDELKNAIRFEADKYIPFDVDEVVLDCQRIEDEGVAQENEMRVLLVACKRNLVDDHLTLLEGAGLVPAVVDVDSFALGNAFEFASAQGGLAEREDGVSALIDIGANKTNINILKGSVSYFTREIYLGGDDFTSGIGKKLNLETHEAEALKRDPGEHLEEVKEAVYPYIDDLGNEIRLSFDYYENQFDREVDQVFLSGGGARLKFLEEAFEKIFEKKTSLWNPVENLKKSDRVDADLLQDVAPQLAIALGLASRLRGEV